MLAAPRAPPPLDLESIGVPPAIDDPAALPAVTPPSHALAIEARFPPSSADDLPHLAAASASKIGGPAAPPSVLLQLRNPDLWLLFGASFAGFGGGIVLLNHVQKVHRAAWAHCFVSSGP
jgi:hypothetical protein